LSPITHKTNISGNIITIKLQLKLVDSDDPISTNNCLFVITEKKPTSKLVLEKYINSQEKIHENFIHENFIDEGLNNFIVWYSGKEINKNELSLNENNTDMTTNTENKKLNGGFVKKFYQHGRYQDGRI
jgi:hypothetical protein